MPKNKTNKKAAVKKPNAKNAPKRAYKTQWDLTLLYSGLDDPKIEADVALIEKEYEAFRATYEGDNIYLESEDKLFEALTRFETLLMTLPLTAPMSYLSYRKVLNGKDSEAEARSNLLNQRLSKTQNKLVFFDLRLAKISPAMQKKFMTSKKLEHFRYYLKLIFERASHNLTEAEEKIMNLKDLTSYSLWVGGTDKVLDRQMVTFKNKQMPLSEALSRIQTLPEKDRKELHDIVFDRYESLSDFAEHELNAIVLDKKLNDELRGYKLPYSATVQGYQNKDETVEAILAAVEKNIAIAHRFYKLKAKIFGKKKIGYQDRNAPIGKIGATFAFDDGVKIVREAFNKLDPRFGAQLDAYLANGQIDAFPREGKTSGAFCAPNLNAPTFVLLNHIDNFNSVMTLAHEMGHAIHTDFSKQAQTPFYQGYTISTAEVASTFFESFAFDEVFQKLSADEKIVALHDRINDDMSTIFRQITCFKFELEMHLAIREKGSMTKEELAALMIKHLSWGLGDAVTVPPNAGYSYVYWSHLRNFFYVYSYAFGQVISKSLYSQLKKDKKFISKIIQFLETGGSMSPEDTFKAIGIDVTKPGFFEAGIKSIEADIDELERLAK